MTTKVPLIPYRVEGWVRPDRPHPLVIKRALPFVQRNPANYVHRPRSAHAWPGGRIAVDAWCGQILQAPRFLAAPPEGAVICATCEGRAVGSGQLGSRAILAGGPELRFSPRAVRHRCEWLAGHRGYGWTDYSQCHVQTSRYLATSPDGSDTLHVCTAHHRSAVTKGWSVEPIDLDWTKTA